MRSLLLSFVLVACGNDTAMEPDPVCETSILTYRNFGEPFLLDWCRGCHSSGIPEDMRQGAPLAANFDDIATVRDLAPAISVRVMSTAAGKMPPADGPSSEERALLAEWLACGAP
jgi:hypothetical protein